MDGANYLHLPNLSIEGFRGIDALFIPSLGRVTLLAGKNSVGKTTVLDAVQVYAARGTYRVLSDLLWVREEVVTEVDEDGDSVLAPDHRALFHDRDASRSSRISIGPINPEEQLTIKPGIPNGTQASLLGEDLEYAPILKAEYGGNQEKEIPPSWSISLREHPPYRTLGTSGTRHVRRPQLRLFEEGEPPAAIQCELLGPGLLDNNDSLAKSLCRSK